MKNELEVNRIYHRNFLENDLPDKCASLIIADPPYFEIKGAFDFVWEDMNAYLKDVHKWATECKRILADNGTLFWYGHAKNIAYQQVILDEFFNLLNNLVWEKSDCQTMRNEVDALRAFAPVTERILMYEQRNARGLPPTGLEMIHNDRELFKPLKEYFDKWLEDSGMNLREAVTKIGSSCTHWFGFSKRDKEQFAIPTKEKFERMNQVHPTGREYEDLRREYEDLRRFFKLPKMMTDVLKYSQESHITKDFDHDTKKPETLTRALILSCSRKEDLVVVPFAGSGTECAMSAKEGRKFIGFDMEEKYVEMANDRAMQHLRQKSLF